MHRVTGALKTGEIFWLFDQAIKCLFMTRLRSWYRISVFSLGYLVFKRNFLEEI